MEQNNQSIENSAEIKLDGEGELISPKPEKKNNKKIILLIIIVLVVIGFGAVYFLFLNKEDNDKLSMNDDVAVLEDKKEVEIDKELDNDQDGLPDYIEKVLGTDINNSDTDGDGYGDFEEIKNGYNPLTDEKYTEEELEVVKKMIKGEDDRLYMNVFFENSDWKTYENKKYGFSFKYPLAWIINESSDEGVILSNYDNSSFVGRIKPDYVELKIGYGAKLSSQSHDEYVKNSIDSIKNFMPYFKENNEVSEILIGEKKYLKTEGYISMYSYEFSLNRVIIMIIINYDLEKSKINDILLSIAGKEDEMFNLNDLKMSDDNDKVFNSSICMPLVSTGNNAVLCNIKVDNTFELLRKSYQNTEKCPDEPIVWGGCFLDEINFDENYIQQLDSLDKEVGECWGETVYVFKAIKKGLTEITTKGTCDYDKKYNFEIE